MFAYIFLHVNPSELLLGVLHARVDCVSLCICLLVSHRCVSLLLRVWTLDVWGELDLTHDMMIFFVKFLFG